MVAVHRRGRLVMPDTKTVALLRTVLDELCVQVPLFDIVTRTNVASKLLEAAQQGRCSLDDLREIGRKALHKTPSMWP
jgi:hypothetical protein